ncbi:conserved hypothetical protein [Theileria orientalis strain Shintoku]|uniref:Uncharacterized protein n=1 Tax=Theileria orientalis strain Shintoku TaxID=869250 RepID=J4DPJ1_THEOR|nr:conserved hypothetical protein [Theileria orientalis strain Shintoku]PVC49987.1 hypothetical protein MACL_00002613 [Theileria orientalis]BAM40794.1 conserved hypothetical protein [Theileria orientalis strain Shintoku]|eukprot:XP_009691095.1 conserved hypothetical protein [Theileria orientalis strain Shintoku]
MEVYSPTTDNAYEYKSDATNKAVNKRRNYQNLQRSIEAHKKRLAMARLKNGKNLPGDELVKQDNSLYCRQSTADTNENYESCRFRRHTQSSLNKITRPVVKYNSLSSSNSFDAGYENEKLYIKKYEDFERTKDESMVKYNGNLAPKYSNGSDFTFDPEVKGKKVELDSDELEKKVVEILGKLLLKQEIKQHSQIVAQESTIWNQNRAHNNVLNEQVNSTSDNHEQVVDILTKCISTTLNSATNESLENVSSGRTSKSVNVEINLNMPAPKPVEQTFTMNVNNTVEEVGDVFIENVFNRDTKIVQENIFKRAYDKVKCLYLPERKSDLNGYQKRSNTPNAVLRQGGATLRQSENAANFVMNNQAVVYKTKKAHSAWLESQGWKNSMNRGLPSSFQWNKKVWNNTNVMNKANPSGWVGNKQETKVRVKPVQSTLNEEKDAKTNDKQKQIARNTSLVELSKMFRPFTRSRSQSVHFQAKNNQNIPPMPRNNTFVQRTRLLARSATPAPLKNGNVFNGFNNVQLNKPQQKNSFNTQPQAAWVDDTFDPFNLKQKFGVQGANARSSEKRLSTWKEKPAVNVQTNNVDSTPLVNRNSSFNFFGRNSGLKRGNQEFLASYNANFIERFEKSGVHCVDPFVRLKQSVMPNLQRTQNVGNQWSEQNRPNYQIPQSAKLVRQSQTPNTLSGVKRINTEPRMLNKFQSAGDAFVNYKQYTDNLSLGGNKTNTRLRLLNSQSVINTLNNLSRLNTMY